MCAWHAGGTKFDAQQSMLREFHDLSTAKVAVVVLSTAGARQLLG